MPKTDTINCNLDLMKVCSLYYIGKIMNNLKLFERLWENVSHDLDILYFKGICTFAVGWTCTITPNLQIQALNVWVFFFVIMISM